MIKILLVDDHLIFRQGLQALLEQEKDFKVVGQTAREAEVEQMVAHMRPDVVLLDLFLHGSNGINITRQLCATHPGVRVVILSMCSTTSYVAHAIRSGAWGYVLKDSSATDLTTAIKTVMSGKRYLSTSLSEHTIEAQLNRTGSSSIDPYDKLTGRERDVLGHAAHGLTNREIGARLSISPRTVEIHRANMMRKLELRNQAELLKFAVSRGILLVDSSQGPAPGASGQSSTPGSSGVTGKLRLSPCGS